MITVSNEWKELHQNRFLPESFVEITLSVADDTVRDQYTWRYWNYSNFGNHGAIVHNKEILPPMYYATLEENLWLLDGTRQIVPDTNEYKNPGYVSWTNAIWSDETSSGSRYQISFNVARTTTTPGLTITWSSEYDEYPTTFKVEALNGDVVVKSATIAGNNSKTSYVDCDFTGYTTMRITPLDWSMPNHKIRIDQIYFGHLLVFDKSNILSYSHEQSGDPLGGELSRNAIEFDIDNIDGRWDLLNPDSMTRYLSEQQSVVVRYGYKIGSNVEWITAGTFYLSEWKLSEDGMKISFSARDVIEFMMHKTYQSAGVSGMLGYAVTDATIYATPQDRYFRNVHDYDVTTLGGILPGDNVVVYDAVEYWYSSTSYEFMYFIGSGWVNAHAISLETPTARPLVQRALNKSLPSGVSYTYTNRLNSVFIPVTMETTNVASFIQNCVNKVGGTVWQTSDGTLKLTSPGMTLTDYVVTDQVEYSQPSIALAKRLKEIVIKTYRRWRVEGMYDGINQDTEEVVNVSDSGETIIIDNPYMIADTIDNGVGYVSSAYRDWWTHRGMLKGDFRADPRLELFDVISVESKYGMISPVMITYIKYTYNGSFHGTFEGKVLDPTVVATANNEEVTEVT
jgi:hypothetical protein